MDRGTVAGIPGPDKLAAGRWPDRSAIWPDRPFRQAALGRML